VRQRFSHMHEDVENMHQLGEHLPDALDRAGQDREALPRYTATGKPKLYS